jgi:hypothetical protein
VRRSTVNSLIYLLSFTGLATLNDHKTLDCAWSFGQNHGPQMTRCCGRSRPATAAQMELQIELKPCFGGWRRRGEAS